MIQTYAHQKQLHEARLDIKSLECLFSNLITRAGSKEDMLCDQWDNFYEGFKDCWVVYRNPEGTPENYDEYLGAPGYGIYPFALAQ